MNQLRVQQSSSYVCESHSYKLGRKGKTSMMVPSLKAITRSKTISSGNMDLHDMVARVRSGVQKVATRQRKRSLHDCFEAIGFLSPLPINAFSKLVIKAQTSVWYCASSVSVPMCGKRILFGFERRTGLISGSEG